MDWELNERYQATALLAVLSIVCLSFLIFQKSTFVRHLRSMLQMAAAPTQRMVAALDNSPVVEPVHPEVPADSSPAWALAPELSRKVQQLTIENAQLREAMGLRQARWPRSIAAHISGRDPQRWFQEVVVDRGRIDGVQLDAAVLAIVEGREGLIGRVVEVMDHTCKVALIQDSLSAVAARRSAVSAEEGVVEGTNGHELVLKYLDRNSEIKIGDTVVTAGLGSIPAEIPLGRVEDIQLDPRQLFLQARLRSSIPSNRISVVLILVPES